MTHRLSFISFFLFSFVRLASHRKRTEQAISSSDVLEGGNRFYAVSPGENIWQSDSIPLVSENAAENVAEKIKEINFNNTRVAWG